MKFSFGQALFGFLITGMIGSVKKVSLKRIIFCFFYSISLMVAFLAGLVVPVSSQEIPGAINEAPQQVPVRIDVKPMARDHEIQARLEDILIATGWFQGAKVRVNDGVVFLTGLTETGEFKKWAGDLARNTQDVAAVVNQIELKEPSIWDFQPAMEGLREQWRGVVRGSPFILFGLLILAVAWGIATLCSIGVRISLRRKNINPLLQDVISKGVGLGVFLIGLYVVFQVAGLTTVALTVMGGTGLLGIVLGIAFRDITENLLASIFLSLQNPFRNGDLIEIAGITGFVQMLTIRATVLMTLDGNHVQIPNATVYKSNIHNFTSNPNRRAEFTVGIGYDDPILTAQEVVLKILAEHPAVLKDPEPWVLVENLGKSTVDLRIYFWIDGQQHSLAKVKSSVIRLVKREFQDAGISMPDEARELIFPDGVSVRLIETKGHETAEVGAVHQQMHQALVEPVMVSTDAEGGLYSEAGEIQEQARQSRTPEDGQNLLKPSFPD